MCVLFLSHGNSRWLFPLNVAGATIKGYYSNTNPPTHRRQLVLYIHWYGCSDRTRCIIRTPWKIWALRVTTITRTRWKWRAPQIPGGGEVQQIHACRIDVPRTPSPSIQHFKAFVTLIFHSHASGKIPCRYIWSLILWLLDSHTEHKQSPVAEDHRRSYR